MVCCHIVFFATFLDTYSRVPNKPTGHLLDNEKKSTYICILFSIKELKSPTHISFFLKKKIRSLCFYGTIRPLGTLKYYYVCVN